MIVTPAEGREVRDPATMRPLPTEGIPAGEHELHWHRLAATGEVTLSPDPAPVEPAPSDDEANA